MQLSISQSDVWFALKAPSTGKYKIKVPLYIFQAYRLASSSLLSSFAILFYLLLYSSFLMSRMFYFIITVKSHNSIISWFHLPHDLCNILLLRKAFSFTNISPELCMRIQWGQPQCVKLVPKCTALGVNRVRNGQYFN